MQRTSAQRAHSRTTNATPRAHVHARAAHVRAAPRPHAPQAVEVIRATTTQLIRKCKEMVDEEEMKAASAAAESGQARKRAESGWQAGGAGRPGRGGSAQAPALRAGGGGLRYYSCAERVPAAPSLLPNI